MIYPSHHITFPSPWCSAPLLRCFDATWQQSLAETNKVQVDGAKLVLYINRNINENIAYNYGIVGELWDNDFQLVNPNTIIYIYHWTSFHHLDLHPRSQPDIKCYMPAALKDSAAPVDQSKGTTWYFEFGHTKHTYSTYMTWHAMTYHHITLHNITFHLNASHCIHKYTNINILTYATMCGWKAWHLSSVSTHTWHFVPWEVHTTVAQSSGSWGLQWFPAPWNIWNQEFKLLWSKLCSHKAVAAPNPKKIRTNPSI